MRRLSAPALLCLGSLRLSLLCLSLLCLTTLALPSAALAHKVSVFAYVDGQSVVVDAFYSKSNKVNQGKLTVTNAATGEEYLRLTTDAAGAASFPLPEKALADRADLRILLVAGEGHQSETLVRASEYAPQKAAPAATRSATPASKAAAASAPAPAAALAMDEAALTRIVQQAVQQSVEQAVDSRLAPVKRLLMEAAEKGPGPTEIAGGIGYIVGIFGVAAFVASRRKEHHHKKDKKDT